MKEAKEKMERKAIRQQEKQLKPPKKTKKQKIPEYDLDLDTEEPTAEQKEIDEQVKKWEE